MRHTLKNALRKPHSKTAPSRNRPKDSLKKPRPGRHSPYPTAPLKNRAPRGLTLKTTPSERHSPYPTAPPKNRVPPKNVCPPKTCAPQKRVPPERAAHLFVLAETTDEGGFQFIDNALSVIASGLDDETGAGDSGHHQDGKSAGGQDLFAVFADEPYFGTGAGDGTGDDGGGPGVKTETIGHNHFSSDWRTFFRHVLLRKTKFKVLYEE